MIRFFNGDELASKIINTSKCRDGSHRSSSSGESQIKIPLHGISFPWLDKRALLAYNGTTLQYTTLCFPRLALAPRPLSEVCVGKSASIRTTRPTDNNRHSRLLKHSLFFLSIFLFSILSFSFCRRRRRVGMSHPLSLQPSECIDYTVYNFSGRMIAPFIVLWPAQTYKWGLVSERANI